ncbi:MAG: hypothetical protein J6X10_08390, partial [Bacteroidales bacterium]|nr:hypothetical protein [Bacteroidales bacterium]
IRNIRSDRGVLVITDYGDNTLIVPLSNRDKLLSFMRSNATNVPLFPMEVIDSLANAASHKVQIKMEAKRLLTEWPYYVIDLNFRYSKSYYISFEEPFFKLSHPFDDGTDFFRLEYEEIESDFEPNGKYRGAHARRYRLDEIMESLEYLAKEIPDLTMEAVIQTTAGEVYTSEKIFVKSII